MFLGGGTGVLLGEGSGVFHGAGTGMFLGVCHPPIGGSPLGVVDPGALVDVSKKLSVLDPRPGPR